MKAIIDRIVYIVGLTTIILLAYTLGFFILANKINYPYESGLASGEHPIRAIYNFSFYPLRWLAANDMSIKSKRNEEYYGWVYEVKLRKNEKNTRSIMIKQPDESLLSIGFTSSDDVLANFDKLEKNQYVMLSFGRALNTKSDTFINKLISFKIVNLPPDPRIKADNFSSQDSDLIFNKYDNLAGEEKICVEKFLKNYQQKVLEHCLLSGYARNIGGGCYHIVGRPINASVINKALKECSSKT